MRDEETQKALDDTWLVIKMLLFASLSVFLWAGSFFLLVAGIRTPLPKDSVPKLGDEANLLFGASSVALIIFSILIGFLAVLGWQTLKKSVKREIESAMEKRISGLEQEIQGRAYAITGFMIGQMHSVFEGYDGSVGDGAGDSRRERRDAYLAEAIRHLQKGYKLLKDLKSLGKYMALNNLVDYSCLLGKNLKPNEIMQQALELKKVGDEYENPSYLLTYCQGVATCGSERRDLEDAMRVVGHLQEAELTPVQKTAATQCVALLEKKLLALKAEVA